MSCASLDITQSRVQLSEFWGAQNLKSCADLGGSQVECEVRDLDLVVLLRSCVTYEKNGRSCAKLSRSDSVHD